jgi:putative nucleotidyltransferase with HDIG domain
MSTILIEPEAVSRGDERESAPHMVDAVRGLVSPPDVCARVLQLVRSPIASAHDIGEVVSRDPTLTARLLRVVNSPMYGLRGRVDTVSRAVTVIGSEALGNLVVAVTAVASFARIPTDLVNMDTFWRHSIFCALLARLLAQRCGVLHPERLFVAGLLHDIGSLVLYHRAPETARVLLASADGDEARLYALELDTFGYSHAHIGALLLESWALPEALQDAVIGHHAPTVADGQGQAAAIVHLAEALANRSGIGGFCEAPAHDAPIDPATWPALGMLPGDLDLEAIIGEAGLQFAETVDLLAVGR